MVVLTLGSTTIISTDSDSFYILLGKEYGIVKTQNNKGIFRKPSNKAL
jgi:hypothetical protein